MEVLHFATGFETAAAYANEVLPFMRRAGEKILEEGKSRAERAGVRAETVLIDNIMTRLSEAVTDQVQAWGADLLVIGTHGRRGVDRMLLGSDAEQILRSASIPVLLVRAARGASPTSGDLR
jgi:nucleotide-binding universal stress UspA family protein